MECTFFALTECVYETIRMGPLYDSEGISSSVRLLDSFSVFVFLRFRPGASSPTLPPGDVPISSTPNVLPRLSSGLSRMCLVRRKAVRHSYTALDLLRHHLESSTLAHVWV